MNSTSVHLARDDIVLTANSFDDTPCGLPTIRTQLMPSDQNACTPRSDRSALSRRPTGTKICFPKFRWRYHTPKKCRRREIGTYERDRKTYTCGWQQSSLMSTRSFCRGTRLQVHVWHCIILPWAATDIKRDLYGSTGLIDRNVVRAGRVVLGTEGPG